MSVAAWAVPAHGACGHVRGTVPRTWKRRLGCLDAAEIAALDTSALEEVFAQKPALHRFPAAMARRVQELCATVAEEYGGDAARVWAEAADGRDLKRRLLELPGIGEMETSGFYVGRELTVPRG